MAEEGKMNSKYFPIAISVIFFITIISGCLNDDGYDDVIQVMNVVNPKELNISTLTDIENHLLFSIVLNIEDCETNLQLDLFKYNDLLIIEKYQEALRLRDVKMNTNYYFTIELYNRNHNFSDVNIIGENNVFEGSFCFDENDSFHYDIAEKYFDTYEISNVDTNLLIITLFPDLFDYYLYFLFEASH